MRTLSAAYLTAAKAAGRYPNIYAIIYGDNSTLTITGKDAIISAKITRGDTAKPAYFEVGRALSSYGSITVDRRRINDESLIVSGAKVEVYAEFDNASGTAIAAEKIATMYISGYDNQDKEIGYISVTDRMVYTGGDFNPDGLTYPILCSDLIAEAFDQSGLSGVTMSLPCDPHVNKAPYKATEPVADGMSGDPYTCREIIAKIAGMQMSDIFIDADGAPKVYDYGNYITTAVTDALTLERRVGSEVFEVYQVLVYKTDERMVKDDAHFQKLPYAPRFEDMDSIAQSSAWWDEIVARAHIFVRKDWTTAVVTIAGVGELEPGDFVQVGADEIPIFVSGIVYTFEQAKFTETIYSFAYTLEEYYQAPSKATEVKTDSSVNVKSGVGEDLGNHSERFNDYTGNTATGNHSYLHIEGKDNTATWGYATHIEGWQNTAAGCNTCNIGGAMNSVTGGQFSVVHGQYNQLNNGSYNAIFGAYNSCNGYNYNIIGGGGSSNDGNTVTGNNNIVGGSRNTVSGGHNNVGGYNNNVGSHYSAVSGHSNEVTSNYNVTTGNGNKNAAAGSIMCGECGNATTNDKIVVGNGTSTSNRSNCFRVDYQGNVYASVYNTSGADYAEYFEWADGNPSGEDRRGLLVQLVGDKIAPAHGDDILGAVSVRPSVCGNAYENEWHGKYKTDIYGDYILRKDGKRQLSDDYDSDREYIPRSQRPEWAAVGMVGRLIICDNGKCQPGGFVTARQGIGVPTYTITNVRCLRRLDNNHIEVLVR